MTAQTVKADTLRATRVPIPVPTNIQQEMALVILKQKHRSWHWEVSAEEAIGRLLSGGTVPPEAREALKEKRQEVYDDVASDVTNFCHMLQKAADNIHLIQQDERDTQ